jgi:hypothetical protein
MKHHVPHDLGKPLAKKAAVAAFDAYRQRFGKYHPTAQWIREDKADISFDVAGKKLKGSLEVKDSTIDMELDVPLLLRPFQGHAIGVIETEINRWISKAKQGEI